MKISLNFLEIFVLSIEKVNFYNSGIQGFSINILKITFTYSLMRNHGFTQKFNIQVFRNLNLGLS